MERECPPTLAIVPFATVSIRAGCFQQARRASRAVRVRVLIRTPQHSQPYTGGYLQYTRNHRSGFELRFENEEGLPRNSLDGDGDVARSRCRSVRNQLVAVVVVWRCCTNPCCEDGLRGCVDPPVEGREEACCGTGTWR